MTVKKQHGPMENWPDCPCTEGSDGVVRRLTAALWPTVWLEAQCPHARRWTERYEFDFSIKELVKKQHAKS